MKKICIITFHNALNYGAVLQAYALSSFLRGEEIDTYILDYHSNGIEEQYKLKFLKHFSSLPSFFNHNITCLVRLKKKQKFKGFQKLLPLTKKLSKNDLDGLKSEYDVFITGSDQVFNYECHCCDWTYYLDFAEGKTKIAYAASFGNSELIEEKKDTIMFYLRDFSLVSLREKEASDTLYKITNIDNSWVVDPVFLLTNQQWDNLISTKKMIKKRYLLVYNIMDFDETFDHAISVSKKENLELVVINRTFKGDLKFFMKSHNKSNCSPSDFLWLIKNSSYFITDSFHGTAFAIKFKIPFSVVLNSDKQSTNSRLFSLLEETGLTSRIVKKGNNPFYKEIDFGVSVKAIEERIVKSKKLLTEALNANKGNIK